MTTATTDTDKSTAYGEQILKHGWVIVPGVLTPEEVARVRAAAWEFYERTGIYDMNSSQFLSLPELRWLPFSERVLSALRAILGPGFTIYPDFNVHFNQYGGWHRDNGSEGPQQYLFDPNYLFVKCGVALQANTPIYGGGIDIVRGGFRLAVGNPQSFLSQCLRKLYFKMARPFMVPTRPGDLVCFDSRLYHRSTPITDKAYALPNTHQSLVAKLPRDKAKIMIYWDASRTDYYVKEFVKNGIRRGKTTPFFADVWGLKVPECFPEDIREIIRREGINVPSGDMVRAEEDGTRPFAGDQTT